MVPGQSVEVWGVRGPGFVFREVAAQVLNLLSYAGARGSQLIAAEVLLLFFVLVYTCEEARALKDGVAAYFAEVCLSSACHGINNETLV